MAYLVSEVLTAALRESFVSTATPGAQNEAQPDSSKCGRYQHKRGAKLELCPLATRGHRRATRGRLTLDFSSLKDWNNWTTIAQPIDYRLVCPAHSEPSEATQPPDLALKAQSTTVSTAGWPGLAVRTDRLTHRKADKIQTKYRQNCWQKKTLGYHRKKIKIIYI